MAKAAGDSDEHLEEALGEEPEDKSPAGKAPPAAGRRKGDSLTCWTLCCDLLGLSGNASTAWQAPAFCWLAAFKAF